LALSLEDEVWNIGVLQGPSRIPCPGQAGKNPSFQIAPSFFGRKFHFSQKNKIEFLNILVSRLQHFVYPKGLVKPGLKSGFFNSLGQECPPGFNY